jgi:hypothetical protein
MRRLILLILLAVVGSALCLGSQEDLPPAEFREG